MTATVLNTKVSEAKRKIPDTCSLVTTTVLDVKIREFANKIHGHAKYVTAQKCQLEKILKI